MNISQGPSQPPKQQPERLPGSVQITAADFNGHTFDGSPFDGDAPWLKTAVENGTLKIADVTDRDYAVFDVWTAKGTVRAFPGDQIVLEADGFLRVHPHPESLSDWARFPKEAAR